MQHWHKWYNIQYPLGWINTSCSPSPFQDDAVQGLSFIWDFSSSSKNGILIFFPSKLVKKFIGFTGTSVGTIIGLLILNEYPLYLSGDKDWAVVFESFFGPSSSFTITTSCFTNKTILLNLLHVSHSDLLASNVRNHLPVLYPTPRSSILRSWTRSSQTQPIATLLHSTMTESSGDRASVKCSQVS